MVVTSHEQSPMRPPKKRKMTTPEVILRNAGDANQENHREITGKMESHSEAWEHAKNLEAKIKKLKEHSKDMQEIEEIEKMLTKVRDHFSTFSKKNLALYENGRGPITEELDYRRKVAELKLARLNQRMVRLLEKLGQPVGEAFAKYKNYKPVISRERSALVAGLKNDSNNAAEYIDKEGENRINDTAERLLKGMGVDEKLLADEEEIVEESEKIEVQSDRDVQGADIIQPAENDSEGMLGDSEIGGVNSIQAPEKKEEVLASAEETSVDTVEESSSPEAPPEDAIQISSGGKTYEFGWHEQVVYTTAKGKKLDCIVLGKSKDENKPGLILKDLEKGKVFALGADAVAQRVRVSDGEIVSPSVENNKSDSGQSVEDEDIFGLKDQPKQEETQWPESYGGPEETLENMLNTSRAALDVEEKQVLQQKKKEREEADKKKAAELSELLGQAGELEDDESLLIPTGRGEGIDAQRETIDRLASNGSLEKINTLLKNKSEVWVQEDGKWYQGVVQDITGAQVGVTVGEEGREKKYFYVDAEEFLGMQDRAKKMMKYKQESELPSIIVSDESLVEKPVPVQKGEINTPTRERVPQVSNDLPSIMVDKEFYKEQWTPPAARERKTYPEVSEKKAIQMIDEVAEAFEKSWRGLNMMVVEKQKTGWFRSKNVEREMTDEEKKAQLEAWLDTVEQAFDSLDKKKDKTNQEKPVLAWHKAQNLMRKLEIGLGQADKEIHNVAFERAFAALNAGVEETRVRLEEKQKKRNGGMLRSGIANWATRIMLGTIGGSIAAGSVETNRAPERDASAQVYSGEEEKKEHAPVENTGESQRNLLSFLMDVNKMMAESAVSAVPFMVDSKLASEIKSEKEGRVPGLVGAEISSDGKSVTLTFDNKKTAQGYPEKTEKSGKEYWRLKKQDNKELTLGEGERMIAETRQLLADAKERYPDIFGTEASKPRQKKRAFLLEEEIQRRIQKLEADPESYQAKREVEEVKKMIDEVKPEVVRGEKKLRGPETMIPRSGGGRKPLEQVKPGLESVSKEKVEEIKAEDLELPQDVFVRFGVRTSEDEEAARLAEEWGRVDKSLKAAEKEGDELQMRKHKTEIKKILEEIKSKY